MRTRKQEQVRAASHTGFSLVHIIFAVAIMLTVFGTLFTVFNTATSFAERNRARTQALFLVNEQIEAIRALPYDSIGTIGGLPHGTIPQIETFVHDGRTYTKRTFIQYIDDPADGLGGADTLAADYKRVKVEISYDYQGVVQQFAMVTTIAPRSQESLEGAGILRIVANDAANEPVPSAQVSIFNNTVATSVDITTFTNASGTVSFPGAWAGSGYEVTVTKSGYSTSSTYAVTTENPNPSPLPLVVPEGGTTEFKVKIDHTSHIDITATQWPVRGALHDIFADGTMISALANTVRTAGTLTLAGAPGSYVANGSSTSIDLTPPASSTWALFYASSTVPASTTIIYHIEHDAGAGAYQPVPDTDLPGNTSGFSTTPIDLSSLSTDTYPTLRVSADLMTLDNNVSPIIDAWTLVYKSEAVPTPGVTFQVESGKTIGQDSGGMLIHKYDEAHTTNASGEALLSAMEFDTYDVTVTSGESIIAACPTLPIVLDPGITFDQHIVTEMATPHAYKVTVLNALGTPIQNADVRLQGVGGTAASLTDECGTAYIPALTQQTYTISVVASGYTPHASTVDIDGLTTDSIQLFP